MSSAARSLQLNTQNLWEKYEDAAMHFNDLLVRLRLQSLAGIAALSTLVGIFGNEVSSNPAISWMVASGLFGAMLFIWLAIFCLDLFYYSRLLTGSVEALLLLEGQTKQGLVVDEINLSTLIEEEVNRGQTKLPPLGVLLFYSIVFVFIFLAAAICMRMTYIESQEWGLSSVSRPKIEATSRPKKEFVAPRPSVKAT